MDKISEGLLTSILIRLPNLQSLSPCRQVSKRWYSILTDSRFIHTFLSHHDCRNPYSSKITFLIETSTIVPSHYDMYYQWQFQQALYVRPRFLELETFPILNKLFVNGCYYYYNCLTQLAPSFLSFLPGPTLRVRASYMELVLVSSSPVNYYVCIPKTRYWVPLPEAPKSGKAPAAYGIVSRPNRQYRIVLFHTCRVTANGAQYQYLVSVFSPETRLWTKHLSTSWPLVAPENFTADPDFHTQSQDSRVVADCKRGVLFWKNDTPDGATTILMFDPYEEESSSRRWGRTSRLTVDPRPLFTEKKIFIGNCLGKLMLCILSLRMPPAFCFEAYELRDEDHTRLTHECTWYLVHRSPALEVNFQELNILDVSFHLLDPRIIFFYDVNVMLRYNMSFMSLDIVGEMPTRIDTATHQLSVFTIVNNTW